jgi:segregation and condensation protein A
MIKSKEIIGWVQNDKTLSWRDIIYRIVKEQSLDPWDVDVSLLSAEYLKTVKKLKELDFYLSGEIVLASALLLKLKSKKLLEENLKDFESLLAYQDDEVSPDEFGFVGDFFEQGELGGAIEIGKKREWEGLVLNPRIPQARRRKVSIYDLLDALEHALETKKKRKALSDSDRAGLKSFARKPGFNIRETMAKVYSRIVDLCKSISSKKLGFSQLMPENAGRKEQVHTFVPLIHLDYNGKVLLEQAEPFGEISITLKGKV